MFDREFLFWEFNIWEWCSGFVRDVDSGVFFGICWFGKVEFGSLYFGNMGTNGISMGTNGISMRYKGVNRVTG
jgi:hypothetical protein